jgi:hypothetical protein
MTDWKDAPGLVRLCLFGRTWTVFRHAEVPHGARAGMISDARAGSAGHLRPLLFRLISDPWNRRAIRPMLCQELNWQSIHAATPTQLIDRFEACLAGGRFFLVERPLRLRGGPAKKTAQTRLPEPETEEWVEQEPETVAEGPAEAYAMPYEAALAQAEALKQAAKSGVPFCEECERASAMR